MADNVELNSGTGGDTLRAEDRTTYKTPVSLIDVGGVAAEALIGDAGIAMPVRGLAAADAALSGNPVPIAARGSAAAPSDMSADNDATIPWVLRNGSFVVNMAVGGTLVTGSAGLPVAQQGTWTVDLGATDNAVLDAIAASVAAIDTDATTIIGHVDGLEGLIGTTNTNTGACATSLAIIDNVVHVDDAAFTLGTHSGVMIMGFAGTQSVNADDACALACSTAGALHVAVQGTVDLGATDNAVLDAIAASVAAIDTDATTIIGHVDGIETLLGTIDADTGGILTAVELIDNAVHVDDAAYTLGTHSGFMIMGFAGTQSVNANDACALACSTAGALFVTVASGGIASGGIASGAIASGAVASGAFASGAFASGAVGSGAIASGAVASGAFASGALAAGSIAAGAIADMLVDDAAFTPATSRVMPAGLQADEGSTDSVDEGDIGCPRMTLTRKVIVNAQPHSAGGCLIFRSIDIDESEEQVKATAGVVYNITAFNTTAAPLYLKFYNLTTGDTTVGTSTPVMTLLVPGNGDSDGAGFVVNNPMGFNFDTAITVACTTGVADADTGAPGGNACIVNVGYF